MFFSPIRKPVRLEKSGKTEQLVLPHIAGGGEALIYEVQGDPTIVAKEYKNLPMAPAHIEKIRTMFRMSPYTPGKLPPHIKLTWPLDLMLDAQSGQPIGFIMPKFRKGMKEALKLIPKDRPREFPHTTWRNLHRIAIDVASTVQLVHTTGTNYKGNLVVGDINESNIVIDADPTGDYETTLLDTDSFQVGPFPGPPPVNFRCTVGKPQYTPPELQSRRFADHDRTPYHDRFAMAVFIWQLLLEGTHPFDGVFQGAGTAPTQEERIAAGHFLHGGANVPYKPMPVAPRFTILDPAIRGLFIRCFQDGHTDPSARPTAQEWVDALTAAILITCTVNSQHVHSPHLQKCPWCTRAKQLKADPYPLFVAPTPTPAVRPILPTSPQPPPAVPRMGVPIRTVDCGQALIGLNGTGTFEIGNTGNAELNVSLVASGPFRVTPLSAKLTASAANAPATKAAFRVVFTPVGRGPATGSIEIRSDDPANRVVTVALTGHGVAPQEIKVAWHGQPQALNFGKVRRGATSSLQSITIQNLGDVDLGNISITVPSGISAAPYQTALGAAFSQAIDFTFTPMAVGIVRDQITITSDDPTSPSLTVDITAEGLPSTMLTCDNPRNEFRVNSLKSVRFELAQPLQSQQVEVQAQNHGVHVGRLKNVFVGRTSFDATLNVLFRAQLGPCDLIVYDNNVEVGRVTVEIIQ